MARLLAIEWDAREARVVMARRRGPDVMVDDAFAVELQPRDAGMTFADTNVGERIGAALTARNVGRSDVIVAVGRANIELRVLTLPPAPDDELPELVRFQAMRQFATLGEDWPLDYTRLTGPQDETCNVLAAAISPELVEQIRATCRAGQLNVERLVLRPFAAASLLCRQIPSTRCRLMVDMLADEADLTVLKDDSVVFLRTVRLPARNSADYADQVATDLLREIRRTMAAAQNQLGGHALEEVVVCGDAKEYIQLQKLIETQLSLPVQVFDPFAGVPISPEMERRRPEASGRFAPLIGMLLDEVDGVRPAIDFLNPRKKSTNRAALRRKCLIGAAVATVVLSVLLVAWQRMRSLDAQVAKLQQQSTALDPLVKAAERKIKDAELIDQFVAADVNWLDELYEVSKELPAADKAFAAQVTLSAGIDRGGQILVNGFADEHSTIQLIERSLRDDRHRVFGKGGSEEPNRQQYPWRFDELIMVDLPAENSSGPATPAPASGEAPRSPSDKSGGAR